MAPTRTELTVGGVFVVVVLLVNAAWMGAATALLSLALIVAYAIWASGRWRMADSRTFTVYLAGIVVQIVHFGEEYLTGFQREFPRLFGSEWSDRQFAAYNVAWLVVFGLAAVGVRRRMRLAYLAVFFFALGGGIGNGVGHLALSAMRMGYFPGAITSIGSFAVGVVLMSRMLGRESRDQAS